MAALRNGGLTWSLWSTASWNQLIARLKSTWPMAVILLGWLIALVTIVNTYVQLVGFGRYVLGLDFRAYYLGGQMVLRGVRGNFYDLATQLDIQRSFAPELGDPSTLLPFMNPPFVAIALAPFAWLPIEYAYLMWALANISLLLYVCAQIIKSWALPRPWLRSLALFLLLTFLPVPLAVVPGQLSFVLVLSFLMTWRELKAGRELRAGLWLALLLIKPQLILVPLIVLLLHRRWRALAGLALAGAGWSTVSLLTVGWDGIRGYFTLLSSVTGWGDAFGVHPQEMQTWRGFLQLLVGTNDAATVQVPWLIGCGLALALLLNGWRAAWNPAAHRFDLRWGLVVLVTLFVSPYANWHDLSLLVVPCMLVHRYILHVETKTHTERLLYSVPVACFAMVWLSFPSAWLLRVQLSVVFIIFALLVLAWKTRPSVHSAPVPTPPNPPS